MATVLAYTSPAIGHLYPMTPLLLELAARGHDVHVRTLAHKVPGLRSMGSRRRRSTTGAGAAVGAIESRLLG